MSGMYTGPYRCGFLRVQKEWVLVEVGYMSTSENRGSQLTSRSVLNDFTDCLNPSFIPKWDNPNAENMIKHIRW